MVLWDLTPEEGAEGSDILVVFVHGWLRGSFPSRNVEQSIRERLPNADLLTPKYTSHAASNADPMEVSEHLSRAIEDAVRERQAAGGGYQRIILVGFSLGGLILRKAYAFARGESQDSSTSALKPNFRWPVLVSRIVLLAGVNRGWSMSPKPKRVPYAYYFMYLLLFPLTHVLPLGRLIRSFQRGAPFVANLRIQWQNLRRTDDPPPPTIQVLGDRDDLVGWEDNIDIQFCKDFTFLSVRETGHENAMVFEGGKAGERRKRAFLRALMTPLEELEGDLEAPPLQMETEREVGDENSEVTDVIFVMHGIRDTGLWTRKMRDTIDHIAREEKRRVFVNTAAYTRFPMSGFLFRVFRQSKVRWFMDRYSEAYARYPEARFHFIGHSNGTYLAANALEFYQACRFDRIVFAGSVVPREFPWDLLLRERRIGGLRNDLASADWVVAIFPHFFQQIRDVLSLFGVRVPRGAIGSGGVYGFLDTAGNRHQVAFVKGDHGAAIDPKNHNSIARYALGLDDEPKIDHESIITDAQPGWLAALSAISFLIWATLLSVPAILVAALAYGWYRASAEAGDLAGMAPWLESMAWLPIIAPAVLVAAIVGWVLSTV